MKPVIAITPSGKTDYARAVELAGGLSLELPLTDDHRTLDRLLDASDGLLLTGGGDVNPSRYGQKRHPKTAGVDNVRDQMEIHLLKRAAKRDVPVFGICRGIQVMNVAFGGTLIQHLGGHSKPKARKLAHEVKWGATARLAHEFKCDCAAVNTSHHQALDKVAPGFDVTARSPDGIIEAMEKRGAKFFCAVQFHPERLVDASPKFLNLFRALVKAARDRR